MPTARTGGAQGTFGQIVQEPHLQRVAQHHGVSAAEVALKWIVSKGVAVVTKSSNPSHLKQDLALFDFDLPNSAGNVRFYLDAGHSLPRFSLVNSLNVT